MRAVGISMIAALLVAGCAGDPCDGVSGTCINAQVVGQVSGLDQLRITLAGAAMPKLSPASPSGAFSLPVRLAIALPASASSPATITVDGLMGGQAIASSGPDPVSFSPGGHASHTFTLVAGTPGDAGVGDGGDGGFVPTPGHVTAFPTTLAFPTTPRGSQSAPQNIMIYNRTGKAVSTVNPDMAGLDLGAGPQGGGAFMPVGASPGCLITQSGISIQAGVDCQVQLVFAPQVSGPQTSNPLLSFDNGDQVAFHFSGTGAPLWTVETACGSSDQFLGVWATAGQALAVGSTGGTPASAASCSSSALGMWTADMAPTSQIFFAISGTNANDVWAGGVGAFYHWSGGPGWAGVPVNDGGISSDINAVWAAGSSEVYAGDAYGELFRYSAGAWTLIYNIGAAAPRHIESISGAGPGQYVVAGQSGYLAVSTGGGPPTGSLTPVNPGTTQDIFSVWEAAPDNIFALGGTSGAAQPPLLIHCTGSPLTCQSESPAGLPNTGLSQISGRNANGMLEVYAVGSVVLHSLGDGTWTSAPVPQNGYMRSVFVLPNGEAYGGGMGVVYHLY